LIVDDEQGWLVNPDDSVVMSNAIHLAISNPSDAKKRGLAAQSRVMESFSEEMMVDRWEEIFIKYGHYQN
jgi:glycosyltransferase involved in cell wall biosynthesis